MSNIVSEEKNSGIKVLSSLVWKFGERIIAQGISFLVSLVLARILVPEQYGTVSMVLVFINIANVFISGGLGEALIQKKGATDEDFSTIFYCGLVISIFLYFVMFILAVPISTFYGNAALINLVRVLALQIPLGSLKTIQHAYVSKHMMFKKFFYSTLGGTLLSGIVGIIMAIYGFGVWALVAQYLCNSVVDMVVLYFTIPWRPKLKFNWKSVNRLLGFGWKMTLAQLINVVYNELRSLVIGKVYSSADLAYYNKGNQLPSLVITNINSSVSSVLFPALANVNDDNAKLKQLTQKSMKLSSYIIFPMMTGLMAVSRPLIRFLFTEKWLPCVPFLIMSCVYWMFQPIQTANVQAIKAAGRSDICLKLEMYKKVIGISLLLITMRISVYAVVLSNTIFGGISMLINIPPNKKIIQYGYIEQFMDVFPALICSTTMGLIVYFISLLGFPDYLTIILQAVSGIVIYILLTRMFKVEAYFDLQKILKKLLKSEV